MAIHVRKSEGPPTTKPEEIGMHHIDTLSKDVYISANNLTLADWVLVGNVVTTFTTFLSLLDTPTDFTSHGRIGVRVNETEDGLEFANPNLSDLGDVNGSPSDEGQILSWDADTEKWTPDTRMDWRGVWIQQTYYKHEVVRDGNYTMIANTETDDRAGPVPEGDPAWALPSVPTWTSDTDSPQAIQGYRLEVGELMEISALRLWRPTDVTTVTYDYLVSDVTDSMNHIKIGSGTMSAGAVGWVSASFPTVLLAPGKVLETTLTTTTYQTSSEWGHSWTLASQAGGIPPVENLTVSADHLQININKQADGAVDATSDLMLLKTGDEILLEEDGNTAKYDKYRVTDTIIDQGAYFEVEVIRIGNGQASKAGKLLNVTATINAAIEPSDYTFLPNFWFGNDPFTGSVGKGFFKTDPDAITILTDNAYGIDIEGVVLESSDDWDLVALSGLGGAGGGGGGSTVFTDLEDTPDNYSGSALYMVRVNGAANQVEFSNAYMKTFNTRSGDVVPEAGDYSASDVGADTSSEVDAKITAGISAHTSLPDPHPQYLLPSELPSVAVTYYTGLVSTIDGAYLQMSPVTLGNTEGSSSVEVDSNDTNILLEQFIF